MVQRERNFAQVLPFGGGDTATANPNGQVPFTADPAGSIREEAARPSGKLDVNGTATFTRDTNSFALTVSTSPVLHYNATCTVRPKFDAGTFKAVVTKNGATSTLTIAFTASCTFTLPRS